MRERGAYIPAERAEEGRAPRNAHARRLVANADSLPHVLPILVALSVCHLLNDLLQALLPAIYPLLKHDFGLTFTQIGLITFTNQVTASILQPVVGTYTDRRPQPYSLVVGMTLTLAGLLLLAFAHRFALLLAAAALVGIGSSIFHPESSRLARMASGGRHGFAQSLFQTGGNFGSSLGPLLAAFIVVLRAGSRASRGSRSSPSPALVLLWRIGRWYARAAPARRPRPRAPRAAPPRP